MSFHKTEHCSRFHVHTCISNSHSCKTKSNQSASLKKLKYQIKYFKKKILTSASERCGDGLLESGFPRGETLFGVGDRSFSTRLAGLLLLEGVLLGDALLLLRGLTLFRAGDRAGEVLLHNRIPYKHFQTHLSHRKRNITFVYT